jgi:molecular chaperone Hsp33
MMLLTTGTTDELLDPGLGPDQYLHRLFHQDGLTLSNPKRWTRNCRCSADRMQTVIRGLPEDDRHYMTVDDRIEVTCEFCNKTRAFDPVSLDRIPDRIDQD